MNNTEAIIKSSYDAKLTNQDLAPLKKQTWGAYNIFAFWMSDVHSVGGYVMAGSLLHSGSIAGRYFYLYSSALQLFSFLQI